MGEEIFVTWGQKKNLRKFIESRNLNVRCQNINKQIQI